MRIRDLVSANVVSCVIALVVLSGLAATPAMAQRVVLDFEGLTLNAYDLDGKKIGSATVADDGQSAMTIAAPGIHYVEFLGTQDDGGVSLDNFTFNPVVPIRR